MNILPVTFNKFTKNSSVFCAKPKSTNDDNLANLLSDFCSTYNLPDRNCNHSEFDYTIAAKIVSEKEKAIKPILEKLEQTNDETTVTACLLLLNHLIDAKAKNVEKTYPIISKFNYVKSHNIQVMLAGIYRKTLVPDAFGPLMVMFQENAKKPTTVPFDPNEEIGGAILEYLRNNNSIDTYSRLSGNSEKY